MRRSGERLGETRETCRKELDGRVDLVGVPEFKGDLPYSSRR